MFFDAVESDVIELDAVDIVGNVDWSEIGILLSKLIKIVDEGVLDMKGESFVRGIVANKMDDASIQIDGKG